MPKRTYRDPLMTHPAVLAYRDAMNLVPNSGFRHDIVVTVNDLDLWGEILTNWHYTDLKGRKKKKNPLDVKGMLDQYEYQARSHAAAPVRDTRQVDTFKESRRESVWWWQRDRVLS